MSSISVGGKDFVLLEFKRQGDDWLEATATELGAPQSELKKVVKKKQGRALPQLEKMGAARRQQIQEVAAEFSAQEAKDVFWEPSVIQNTDERRNREGKLSVKAFKVIFARRSRGADPAPSQPAKASKPKVKQPDPPKPKEAKPEEKPKEAEKPKFQRPNTLNDPFSSVPLFSMRGEPMDVRGPIPYANQGFPAHIQSERPLGFRPPPPPKEPPKDAKKNHPQLDPLLQGALGGIPGVEPGLDELLGEQVLPGAIDGILNLSEDPVDAEERPHSRHKYYSTSRRRSSALRDGGKGFRSTTRFSDHYPSSISSWASDESAIVGEWDDLSSRTSEETDSLPRSPLRKTYRRYYPQKKYYHDPRLQPRDRLIVEDNRRQHRPAIEPRKPSPAFEEPKSARPVVHQNVRPLSQQSIPPEAVFPSHFENAKEERAEDYMRDRTRAATETRNYGPARYDFEPRDYRRNRSYY